MNHCKLRIFIVGILLLPTLGCGGSVQDEMRQRAEQLAKLRRAERAAEEKAETQKKQVTVADQPQTEENPNSEFPQSTPATSGSKAQISQVQESVVATQTLPPLTINSQGLKTFGARKPSSPMDQQARRKMCLQNLRKLGDVHKEHKNSRFLPYADIADSRGKPLLSWRVNFLKSLGYETLFNMFNRDESWDSPHNIQLLHLIPDEFMSPERFDEKTNILAVKGEKFACRGRTKIRSEDMHLSVAIVEVNNEIAVPWTKPQDYETDEYSIGEGLGGLRQDGTMALLFDGSLVSIPRDYDQAELMQVADISQRKDFAQTGLLPPPLRVAETNASASSQKTGVVSLETGIVGEEATVDIEVPPIPGLPSASLMSAAATGTVNSSVDPLAPASNETVEGSTYGLGNPARGSLQVPTNDEIREASDKLRDLFAEQLAGVKDPREKSAIARRMFDRASLLHADPAGLFALLTAVRNIAVASGNFQLHCAAGEQIKQTFDVEGYRVDMQTMRSFGILVTSRDQEEIEASGFGRLAMNVLKSAIKKDEYADALFCTAYADKMIKLGDNSVSPELVEEVKKNLQIAHNRYKMALPAIETLAKAPEDGAAATQVGCYLCFVKGSWREGVRLLRKSNDPLLVAAATAEDVISSGANATTMVEVGDKWWRVASKSRDSLVSDSSKGRAVFWYQRALPNLGETLDRLRANSRIQDSPSSLASCVLERVVRVHEQGVGRHGVRGSLSGVSRRSIAAPDDDG